MSHNRQAKYEASQSVATPRNRSVGHRHETCKFRARIQIIAATACLENSRGDALPGADNMTYAHMAVMRVSNLLGERFRIAVQEEDAAILQASGSHVGLFFKCYALIICPLTEGTTALWMHGRL